MSLTTTFWITDAEGDDVELAIEYEAQYQPAILGGPPERCCPVEGELNVISVSPSVALTELQKDYIEEHCWEDFFEKGKPE